VRNSEQDYSFESSHFLFSVSSIASPREIRPVTQIPKTKSGKIMRRVLRSWITGEDLGDLSTLEDLK
jgi:acetyl-CoA synthetase